MDPKQNSNQPLDPKLQEVYDRVMGVNLSGGIAGASPATDSVASQAVQPPADPLPTPPAMPSDPLPTPNQPLPPLPTPGESPLPDTAGIMPPVTPIEPSLQQPSLAMPRIDNTQMGNPVTPPAPDLSMDPALPMDSMSSTINAPHAMHHDVETVKIGTGGSPVGVVAKPKGKGLSPLILIFGAFAFLAVYAVFWVKFFGYTLPFLPH